MGTARGDRHLAGLCAAQRGPEALSKGYPLREYVHLRDKDMSRRVGRCDQRETAHLIPRCRLSARYSKCARRVGGVVAGFHVLPQRLQRRTSTLTGKPDLLRNGGASPTCRIPAISDRWLLGCLAPKP